MTTARNRTEPPVNRRLGFEAAPYKVCIFKTKCCTLSYWTLTSLGMALNIVLGLLCFLTVGNKDELQMKYSNVLLFISPDIDDHRLQIAKQYGATHAINVAGCNSKEVAQRVVQALSGDAPDISLECSGSDLSLVACIHVSILCRWLQIMLITSLLKLQTHSTFRLGWNYQMSTNTNEEQYKKIRCSCIKIYGKDQSIKALFSSIKCNCKLFTCCCYFWEGEVSSPGRFNKRCTLETGEYVTNDQPQN